MKPIAFPQANTTLQKPDDMSAEECASLPICRDGPQMISCWEPTWRERFSILLRGRVWLRVLALRHPPVLVEGESPFLPAKADP